MKRDRDNGVGGEGIRELGIEETFLSDFLKLRRYFFSQGLRKEFSYINVRRIGIINPLLIQKSDYRVYMIQKHH